MSYILYNELIEFVHHPNFLQIFEKYEMLEHPVHHDIVVYTQNTIDYIVF